MAQWERTHLPMQEMQKMWVWSLDCEDPLEEEMATHSSIFAWEIPWTEEPGRLQSMGSQRDWVTEHEEFVWFVFSPLQEGFDLQVASAFIDNYPPDHITSSLAINEWLNFSIWTKKTNCLCIFNFKDLWPSFLTSELVVSFWELTQKYALELSEWNDGWKQIVQIEEFKTVQSFLFITYPCTFKAPPPMCSYCQNLQISWTSISCQHGQTLPSPGEPGNSSCCFGTLCPTCQGWVALPLSWPLLCTSMWRLTHVELGFHTLLRTHL